MKKYIATFYTHFYALKFQKETKFISNTHLMPVPRHLSSSCGTCCYFETEKEIDELNINYDEVEKIFPKE